MGVAILMKKDLNANITATVKDNEGRILSLNFSIENQKYQIINVYTPTRNSEKLKF